MQNVFSRIPTTNAPHKTGKQSTKKLSKRNCRRLRFSWIFSLQNLFSGLNGQNQNNNVVIYVSVSLKVPRSCKRNSARHNTQTSARLFNKTRQTIIFHPMVLGVSIGHNQILSWLLFFLVWRVCVFCMTR